MEELADGNFGIGYGGNADGGGTSYGNLGGQPINDNSPPTDDGDDYLPNFGPGLNFFIKGPQWKWGSDLLRQFLGDDPPQQQGPPSQPPIAPPGGDGPNCLIIPPGDDDDDDDDGPNAQVTPPTGAGDGPNCVITPPGGDDDDTYTERTPLDDAIDQGAAAVQQGVDALTDTALGAIYALDQFDQSLGGPLDALANGIDALASGIAGQVSGGATDRARQSLYGDAASTNQQGVLYRTGQGVGFGINIALAFVNPCNTAAGISTGLRAFGGLQALGNGLNSYDSYQKGDYLGALQNGLAAAANLAQYSQTCFAAGTPLVTPDGSKPIEKLKLGDLVLSRDENDPEGLVVPKPVINLFQNYSPLLDLHIRGQVVRTTAEHPFWVVGRGWVAAQQILIGDLLLSTEGEPNAVQRSRGGRNVHQFTMCKWRATTLTLLATRNGVSRYGHTILIAMTS